MVDERQTGGVGLTPKRAEQIARELHPEPVLINYSTNALYRVGECVLARIGPAVLDAARTLRLVHAVHDAGVDVLVPISNSVRVRHGLEVTLWPYVPPPEVLSVPDYVWLGETLRVLHDQSAWIAARAHEAYSAHDMMPWRLRSIAFRIASAKAAGTVTAAQAETLDVRFAMLAEELSEVRWTHEVLMHGDVHQGNLLAGPDGWRLVDLDSMRGGPRAWDLVPLAVQVRRFGEIPSVLDDVVAGYGVDVREDPHFEALCDLRELSALAWCAALADHLEGYQAESDRRFDDPDHVWTVPKLG